MPFLFVPVRAAGGCVFWTARRWPRSQAIPSASGKAPWGATPVLRTSLKPAPSPTSAASRWTPSRRLFVASVVLVRVRSSRFTKERFLYFHLGRIPPGAEECGFMREAASCCGARAKHGWRVSAAENITGNKSYRISPRQRAIPPTFPPTCVAAVRNTFRNALPNNQLVRGGGRRWIGSPRGPIRRERTADSVQSQRR